MGNNNFVISVTCLFLLCIHYVFAFNHLQPQYFHRRQFSDNNDDDSSRRYDDIQRQQQQMALEKDTPLFHSWLATNESKIFYIRSSALGNEWQTATTDESTIIDNGLLQQLPDMEHDDDDEPDYDTDLFNLYHPIVTDDDDDDNNDRNKRTRNNNAKNSKRKHHNNKKFNDLNIINDTNLTRSNVRHIASRYRRQQINNKQISNKKNKKRKKRLRSVPDLSFINKHHHHHHQSIHWPIKKEAVIEGDAFWFELYDKY